MWNSQVGRPEFFVFEFVEKKKPFYVTIPLKVTDYYLDIVLQSSLNKVVLTLSLWLIPCSILPLERTAFQQQFHEMPFINRQKFHILPFIAPGEAPPDFESKQV